MLSPGPGVFSLMNNVLRCY